MTPEQIAEAVEWAKTWMDVGPSPATYMRDRCYRALLAEHDRAERNEKDAQRWRAVRNAAVPCVQNGARWWEIILEGDDCATVDEAVDRLIKEKENANPS